MSNIKHGESSVGTYSGSGNQKNTRLYRAWHHIKENKSFPIDKNWSDSFIAFRSWALSNGYDESNDITHFIRKDRKLGWIPDNTIISPIIRESHVFLTHNGITMTMSDWAKKLGVSKQLIYMRINKLHWPVEKSLTYNIPIDPDCLFD